MPSRMREVSDQLPGDRLTMTRLESTPIRWHMNCCQPRRMAGPSGVALRHGPECSRRPGARICEATARMLAFQAEKDRRSA